MLELKQPLPVPEWDRKLFLLPRPLILLEECPVTLPLEESQKAIS